MAMQMEAGQCGIGPKDRLPSLTLPAAPDGHGVALREPAAGASPVLVLPEDPGPAWLEYAADFASPRPAYHYWSARPLVLVQGDVARAGNVATAARPGSPRDTGTGATFLADVDGAVRRRLGIPTDAGALIIADRWGEVYHASCGPAPDRLPEIGEVEDWLRFLATQCPECGVPDEP